MKNFAFVLRAIGSKSYRPSGGAMPMSVDTRGSSTPTARAIHAPNDMPPAQSGACGYPHAPLWAGGMSFGAWIALAVGVDDPRVSTLIGIAPPLGRYDFEPIARSTKAKFFIQGERDEL